MCVPLSVCVLLVALWACMSGDVCVVVCMCLSGSVLCCACVCPCAFAGLPVWMCCVIISAGVCSGWSVFAGLHGPVFMHMFLRAYMRGSVSAGLRVSWFVGVYVYVCVFVVCCCCCV